MNVKILTFEDIGCGPETADLVLWQKCQERQLIFITANRNHDGEDSLESAIRRFNRDDSLPVITIANADRVLNERSYAEKVAVRLIDYLIEVDQYRGAGRVYAP